MWRLPFDHKHIPDADSETGKVHYCENQKLEAHSEGYIYGKTQPWVGGCFKAESRRVPMAFKLDALNCRYNKSSLLPLYSGSKSR